MNMGSKPTKDENAVFDYAKEALLPDEIRVPAHLQPFNYETQATPKLVCVTGVTGYLGTFIVLQLLQSNPDVKIVCIVRAKSDKEATTRIVQKFKAHDIWSNAYAGRIHGICGDISQPHWGLSADTWDHLANNTDVIIHNGAVVHWIYPYSKLVDANVGGTIDALKLSIAGKKIKPVHFLSSIMVLETPEYWNNRHAGFEISEADPLEKSRFDLKAGYKQTKWVAEKLCAQAYQRGIPVTVIRPGFIAGHSKLGVSNPDNFVWRLVKGCIELGKCPNITEMVNIVPADYVAHVVVALTLHTKRIDFPSDAMHTNPNELWGGKKPDGIFGRVYHTFNPETYRVNDLLINQLQKWYPKVAQVTYPEWREALIDHVKQGKNSSLFPLLEFVCNNLPLGMSSPKLSTVHTNHLLTYSKSHKELDTVPSMHKCIPLAYNYLIQLRYLPLPNDNFVIKKEPCPEDKNQLLSKALL